MTQLKYTTHTRANDIYIYTCIIIVRTYGKAILETRYIEKKVFLGLLCGVQHSVIMANFIMPETQQPIIVD